jgi:uncharacterized membrane protein YoaK (UPF0700 family)
MRLATCISAVSLISFMSGNSTQLAVALGQRDLAEACAIAELIGLFVLGAAAGQVLAGVLATAPELMVLAMGTLNASMHRAGKIPVRLTFVTGMLVRFG